MGMRGTNFSFWEKEGSALFPRDFQRIPIRVERGDGVYLYDSQGKRYLDAAAGAAVCNLGHNHPEIVEALHLQAQRLAYAHPMTFVSLPLLELAERLVQTAPTDLTRACFASGGSEANETAIKLARQYHVQRGHPSKYKVLARRVSYHGATLGALALSGQVGRRRAFSPLLKSSPRIAPAYCYRCPFGKIPERCALECADDLERAILEEGPENVAAFIAEPVSGSSAPGAYPPDSYWEKIRKICDRYDVLLIVDEVMCGIGRTGRWWAIQHSGVMPDLLTTAKGLSGGYTPIGAVLVHERIYRAITETNGNFFHGFTFGGNPLSCAVAVKVLEILDREGLVARAQEQGEKLLAWLHEALSSHPHVGEIRGRGLLLGVEFVADRETKRPFPADLDVRGRIARAALEQGLYLYPGGGSVDGIRGDHVLIAPPLIIEDEQLAQIVEGLVRAVQTVFPSPKGTSTLSPVK